MKPHKKKILSDSVFLSGGDLLLRLKGVILIPIIVSAVGIASYGAFIQIIINVSMIVPFCTLELGMGFYRFTSKYNSNEREKISHDYWSVLAMIFILSIFGGLIIYLFSPVISKYILAGKYLDSLRLSSLFVVIEALNYVNVKFIQSRKKFKLFSIYNLFYKLAPYLGFVIGILLKKQIFFGFLLYLVSQSIIMLSLKIYVIRSLVFSRPSVQLLKKFIKYSWALLFSDITGGLLSKVDRYFIGYFLGPASIGIYNIVYSVCSLLGTITVPFKKYFGIYMPKIWDKGKYNKVRDQLREGLVYYITISMGGLACIAFILKPVVKLFLERDLSGIANFEWLVLITGLGIIGLGTSRFFYQLLRYRKQSYLQLVFQSISLMFNILLNYFLVKEYGIIGAGIATFVSYALIVLMCNHYLNMNLDFRFLTKLLKIGASSIAIVFWLYFSSLNTLFDIGLNTVIGLIIYTLFVFLLRIVSLKDLKSKFA